MKRLLTVSTSTIGGAVIILVLNIVLGDKAPWFVEKLYAKVTNDYEINLNIDAIKIPQKDFDKASPEDYIIDKNEKFLINKPSDPSWKVSTINPGRLLDGMSLQTVPIFGHSLSAFSSIFAPTSSTLSVDNIVTTSIASNRTYTIGFTEKSKISGFELDLNPADDKEFVKSSLVAGGKLMNLDSQEIEEILNEKSDEAKKKLSTISQYMKVQYGQIIKSRWPKSQRISDNVTVTTFSKTLLNKNPISALMSKCGSPNLMTNFSYLTLMNPELMNAAIQHIEISKKNDVILVNASLMLENITVDDAPVTKAELGRAILIVDRPERINVITLNYLSGPGATRARLKELESIMQSFRIVI
jgi:hypothetical protein